MNAAVNIPENRRISSVDAFISDHILSQLPRIETYSIPATAQWHLGTGMIQKFHPIFMSRGVDKCETTTALLEYGSFSTSAGGAAFQLWIFTEVEEIETDDEPDTVNTPIRIKTEPPSIKRRNNPSIETKHGSVTTRESGPPVRIESRARSLELARKLGLDAPTYERAAAAALDLDDGLNWDAELDADAGLTDSSLPSLSELLGERPPPPESDDSNQNNRAGTIETRHKRSHSKTSPSSQRQSGQIKLHRGRGRGKTRGVSRGRGKKSMLPETSRYNSSGSVSHTRTVEVSHGYGTRAAGSVDDI